MGRQRERTLKIRQEKKIKAWFMNNEENKPAKTD